MLSKQIKLQLLSLPRNTTSHQGRTPGVLEVRPVSVSRCSKAPTGCGVRTLALLRRVGLHQPSPWDLARWGLARWDLDRGWIPQCVEAISGSSRLALDRGFSLRRDRRVCRFLKPLPWAVAPGVALGRWVLVGLPGCRFPKRCPSHN